METGDFPITVLPPDFRLANWPYTPDDDFPVFFWYRHLYDKWQGLGWRALDNNGNRLRYMPRAQ